MSDRMPLAKAALKNKMIPDDTVLFDIQVARDLMPPNIAIDFSKVGPVRLPYPTIFMEYREPMLVKQNDADFPSKVGFLITESDDHRSLYMKAHFLFDNDGAMNDVIELEYKIDENGFLIYGRDTDGGNWKAAVDNGNNSVEAFVYWSDDLGWSLETIRDFTPIVAALARACLTALGLINCRNVKLWDGGRIRQARSGADKRRGIPAKEIRYSTIILPGGGSERVGTGSGTHHRASAVHRVRGHFKTYTADAPLMGRHVGTYWWGWNIRGSVESGVVESDYTLGRDTA
jgi:hypothetical protein